MIVEHRINPYPRTMWVAIGENFDNIKSKFCFNEDQDFTQQTIEDNYDGIVFDVTKDNHKGYLVFLIDSDNLVLVHEASHIVLSIYADCGMVLDPNMDQEPFCYLTEYIFKLLKETANEYT